MKSKSGIHIIEVRDLMEMLSRFPPELSVHIAYREANDPEGEDETDQFILGVRQTNIGVAITTTEP